MEMKSNTRSRRRRIVRWTTLTTPMMRTTLVLFFSTLIFQQQQPLCPMTMVAQAQPSPPPFTSGGGTSSISGTVFFDSSSDGVNDFPTNTLDYGVPDVFTTLLRCDVNEIVKTTKTDSTGYYEFTNIEGGRYYVNFQPETWYVFTPIWNGATNDNGELLYPNVDSAVDPESGLAHYVGDTSPCTELQEGEEVSLSAGLNFYIPPVPVPDVVTAPPTVGVTFRPTVAVTTVEPTAKPTTAEPTGAPTVGETPQPTKLPTAEPTPEPTPQPIPSTPQPTTLPPSEAVTIGGYVFADFNNNGYFDPGEDLLEGVQVQLYRCISGRKAEMGTAETGSDGFYDFSNLSPENEYSISFNYCEHELDIPSDGVSCLMGSEVWIGLTDVNGNLVAPDANSHADPSTGETQCVEYGVGEEVRDVSAGVFHRSMTLAPVATPDPTPAPTMATVDMEPTTKPTVLAEPTSKPTEPTTISDPTLKPTILSSSSPSFEDEWLLEGESIQPSASPTISLAPSIGAIPAITTSSPTSSPTAPPARVGEEYGPIETNNLQMTIRGIDTLDPDDATWAKATSEYIMEYFNNDPEAKVWDVVVDIIVTNVKSEQPDMDAVMAELFGTRQRRGLRVDGKKQHQQLSASSSVDPSNRELQTTKSVTITYDQYSKYKTSDVETYDGEYVATTPFMTREGSEAYVKALQGLYPTYLDVTSVGSVLVNPPGPAPVKEQPSEDGGGDKTLLYAIIGGVCGAAVLVAAAVLILYRRKRARRNGQEHVPVGNGPAESMRQVDDLESSSSEDSSSGSSSESESDGGSAALMVSSSSASNTPSPKKSRFSFRKKKSSTDNGDHDIQENPTDSTSSNTTAVAPSPVNLSPSDVVLDIIAPPGKLGVIVDTPPSGGCSYVCEIKDSCPIIGQIQLEDKIIAVDDDDVQTMSAVNVSKMLARRSRNLQRKITVLRSANGPSGAATAASSGGVSTDVSGGNITQANSLLGGMQNEDLQRAHSMAALLGGANPDSVGMTTSNNNNNRPQDDGDDEWMDFIAPAGKLGVVLVTPEPPDSGPAYVFKIREDSPLVGKVKLGDKIVAVDDEDVREMSAINVSKLLGSKSTNAERKISVLREVRKGSGSAGESDSISSESSASEGSTESSEDDGNNGKTDSTVAEKAAATAAPSATGADQGGNGSDGGTAKGIKLDIVAPAGKLGVVVDSPPGGGSAYVSDVKEESPVRGEIHLGDRIIAVDDEDVSKLKAIHVSMLLGSKSRNAQRKITVLRDG